MEKSNPFLDYSEPVAIYSDHKISKEEILRLLLSIGGIVDHKGISLGHLSEGDKHVWIYLSNEELSYLFDPEREEIHKKLGNVPRTCVTLQLNSAIGSKTLLPRFVIPFANRWNCVITSMTNQIKVYTLKELQELI